ncbi:Filamin-A-interacting protein [Tritrichomonas foetus]|uniref:Filamin-A-interacting protein n=1 Tax=Tritrichomonas foetus TaxID=1144522 RepID=A0A1J4JFH7_9EUKA|nr:Filamin-A-interacting protein [Tritrichomonas foetus]|eukprot:OHS96213.1 Filamin-A-interacting protein [Tritrichomonas foetus]
MTEKKQDSYQDDDASSFEDIQNNFQSVISDLVNDRSLDAFRNEYQKLYDAFQESHTNNQNLIAKCRELNQEINTNSTKVQAALKFSQEDQRTITILRRDFEKAWKTVESLHARESKSKDIINALKTELQHLSELAEQQGAIDELTTNPLPEDLATQLKSEIKAQAAQIETLKNQITQNREKNRELSMNMEVLKNTKNELDFDIKKATDELNQIDADGANMSKSLIEIKQKNRTFQSDIETKTIEVGDREKQVRKISIDLKTFQPSIEDYELTIRMNQNKINDGKKRLENRKQSSDKLLAQKAEILRQIEERDKEIFDLKADLKRQTEQNEKCIQLNKEFTEKHLQLTDQINQARHQITLDRQKVFSISKEFWSQDSNIKSGKRQINTTQQAIIKQQGKVQKIQNEAEISKVRGETIENEVMIHKNDQGSMRSQLAQLDSEIESAKSDLLLTNTNTTQFELEAQKNKDENRALEKQLHEITRQKHQREAAMKELNDHHVVNVRKYQTLIQKNEEIERELHYLKLNVTEFKETITKTDDQCMEVHSRMKLLENQSQKLLEEKNQMVQKLADANTKIINMENETITQCFILSQSKNACTEIQKDMQNIKDNMKNCENEICKREKEIAMLREKSKVYADECSIAGSHYGDRIVEVDKFKQELIKESEKLQKILRKKQQFDRLQDEYNRIQKELLIAQSQAKMLEEEATTPIAVHRWRLLESSNPELFQCIQMKMTLCDKITTLINRNQRLKLSKESMKKTYDHKSKHIQRIKNAAHMNMMRQLENQYRKKDIQLSELSDQTQKQKEETDEWRDRVNFQENLIIQQKEQFYITKLRDAPVAVPVREPTMKFNKGQAPRSIVPRLRIVEPKPDPPRSTRGVVKRANPIVPILPPLVPAKTAR